MKFWLGAPEPAWLNRTAVPLMVSRRRLNRTHKLPRARGPWMLDSGGFTELDKFGGWTITERQYVNDVRRYRDQVGLLQWAAPMDWMCEPFMLAKTGLTVAEHQHRTIDNYLTLIDMASDVPWIPVLQGQTPADYLYHADEYERRGVILSYQPVVGLGSVCRRQSTSEIGAVVVPLADRGYRLHGFGMKTLGVRQVGRWLESADSQAWSAHARSAKLRLPGHTHQICNYCLTWALQWRAEFLSTTDDDSSRFQSALAV